MAGAYFAQSRILVNQQDLPARLRSARRAAGLTQEEVARRLGVHVQSVSNWERGLNAPEEARLALLAQLYVVEPAALRYGAPSTLRERVNYVPNPALKRRLPPRAYERVLGYLQRMESAGCTDEQIDEAERLMIDGAFNKLNKRDVRERTEDDLIVDIDAAWAFIAFVLRREGFQL